MKKISILTALVLAVTLAFGQRVEDEIRLKAKPIFKQGKLPQKMLKKLLTRYEDEDYYPISFPLAETYYDLQSNSCTHRRIVNHGNGKVSLVFMQESVENVAGFANRGSGYRFNANIPDGAQTDWQFVSTPGVVQTVQAKKSGWGTLLSCDTSETVVSHAVETTGFKTNTQKIGAAGENWSGKEVNSGPEPMLWPASAASGHNYYVAAVDERTTPAGQALDIDGVHIYHSPDAGNTWEYRGILPDFKKYYPWGSGDSYEISAVNDSVVAVVFFSTFADVRVWKSIDYGKSWKILCVNDFPEDAYNMLTTDKIIDMNEDEKADTINTVNGSGAIILDNDAKVHVVFDKITTIDEDVNDDGAYSYFPQFYVNLVYWNEDMPEGNFEKDNADSNGMIKLNPALEIVSFIDDLNDKGGYDFVNVPQGQTPYGGYGCSVVGQPSLGVDKDNNIYCAFSKVRGGSGEFIKNDANPNPQNFRHVHLAVRKADVPEGEPHWRYELGISEAIKSSENVFPNVARDVDENVYLYYMSDNEPGINLQIDKDPIGKNSIVYTQIPVADLFARPALDSTRYFITEGDLHEWLKNKPQPTAVAENEAILDVDVYPNPTTGVAYFSNVENAEISIYNILGGLVYSVKSTNYNHKVDMSKFSAGTYVVKVVNKEGTATKKLLVK